MTFITAIEFMPSLFTEKEYNYPKGTSKELPDEWNTYWRKCLNDSNLSNIKAIKKGYFYVDITTLRDDELEIYLDKALDKENYEEIQLTAILGGNFITKDDEFIIASQCCDDLGNLYLWEEIFEKPNDEWYHLWIGHPWIFYKRSQGFIEFSDYFELNLSDINDIQAKHKIPEDWLRNEIVDAKQRLAKLTARIEVILKKNNK